MKIRILFLGFIFLAFVQPFSAQNKKEKALIKAKTAQKLLDAGNADSAMVLLEQAIKLDPQSIDYPYELAYSMIAKKEYALALTHLQALFERKDVSDLVYELAGNCYENMQQPDKAMETYQAGLKKFTHSGRLYLESGLYETSKKEYNRALVYFEKGIETDPSFASNYYWASKLFCHSTESVWGMIYGEIFVNLERGSKRSEEISKLLFDTYKSQIKFRADTTFTVNFSKLASPDPSDSVAIKNKKIPFGVGAYEPVMALAVLGESEIELNALDRIRQRFVDTYFKNDMNSSYPNILFEFQREVIKAGQFEAYNHWLLMEGDRKAFNEWHKINSEKWLSFGYWFKDHTLKLDKDHRFYRAQY